MEEQDTLDSLNNSMDDAAGDFEKMTMTFWYCPEFPAMPLRYVYNIRGNAPYTFTVEAFR